ncbi:MAG: DUF308 domain-containing protein [Parasporobacterium sp.]|nr:DUF308 domain-containing protein [Parasporobacterium sp.]
MSSGKRVLDCLIGLLMLFCAFIILLLPETGYVVVVAVMDILLLVSGIRLLIFYFRMARHMVDGLRIFFKGVFLVDLAIFAISLNNISKVFVILYLIGIFAVNGGLRAFRALDGRKHGTKHWRFSLAVGICSVVIAILALIFMNNMYILMGLCFICLLYTGIMRIVNAFKKSAIVYVEI